MKQEYIIFKAMHDGILIYQSSSMEPDFVTFFAFYLFHFGEKMLPGRVQHHSMAQDYPAACKGGKAMWMPTGALKDPFADTFL